MKSIGRGSYSPFVPLGADSEIRYSPSLGVGLRKKKLFEQSDSLDSIYSGYSYNDEINKKKKLKCRSRFRKM